MSADPREILSRVFRYSAFRGQQEAAIRHVIGGGDALVLMPTGGGKSLCYQVPALCRAGTAIIVSPLIALMNDQVAALRARGVSAGALHSENGEDERRVVGRALAAGELDLLFVSPERLLANGTADRLARLPLALFAIDEAHCVSEWGHDFRPEYRTLAEVADRFHGVPRIALTATADRRTRPDILRVLRMDGAEIFASSFHRPNLRIAAQPKTDEVAQLNAFLDRHRGACGIIYCGTRKKTEVFAAMLRGRGIAAIAFHAGMESDHKREAASRFRAGEAIVIVATIAFGMGIDRPDVRFVVHLDMPDSPEAFYQQIGRAGRDGEKAETLLLAGAGDAAMAFRRIAQSAAPDAQKWLMRAKLDAMIGLAETAACRTRVLLNCFGESLDEPCGHCDTCENPPRIVDAGVEAQKALSAVRRTHSVFGAPHIIAILRGERTEAVLRHHHDTLPTFGVGVAHPVPFWQALLRQLIAQGALDVDPDRYNRLIYMEDHARALLRGEGEFRLRAETPPGPPRERRRDKQAAPSAAARPARPGAEARYQALRAWRLAEGKAGNVPAFLVFADTALHDIANANPSDLAALGRVKGVGPVKLERYGAAVLSVLASAYPTGAAPTG